MKKLIGAVTALLLLGAMATPTQAAYTPPNFDPKLFASGQYISLADASFGLWSSRVTSRANARDEILCTDQSAECGFLTDQGRQISANLNFTVCNADNEIDCVRSISLNGETYSVSELAGDLVAGNSQYFLPAGSGPILATGSKGSFIVAARGEYQLDFAKRNFVTRALDVEVMPVAVQSGSYQNISMYQRDLAGIRTVSQAGENTSCYYNTSGNCYLSEQSRLEGLEIKLDLQLSSKWTGFFKGRLTDPELTIKTANGVQRLSLTAQSAKTHKVFFKVNWDEYGEAQKDAVCTGTTWCEGLSPGSTGSRNQLSSTPAAMAIVQAFGKHHNDTAAEDVNEWSFGVGRSIGEACLAPNQGLVGMVTSNAPVFQAGPPALISGALTYDIAGLHYASDGKTLNIGYYSLQIRSDVARCLYGLSGAPISATVQVTNDKGTQVVSTSVVSERDGWLRLNANGFTYSKKRVKVRITQPAQAVIQPFAANKLTLSSAQSTALKSALKNKISGSELTCTGLYSTASKASLAKKQADAVCSAAKKLRPGLITKTYSIAITGTGLKAGSVVLRSN